MARAAVAGGGAVGDRRPRNRIRDIAATVGAAPLWRRAKYVVAPRQQKG
jgi:hypothetical protein